MALAKTCTPDEILLGGTTSCTITATNNSFSEATVEITDQLPTGLSLVSGSVTGGTALGNGARTLATLDGRGAAAGRDRRRHRYFAGRLPPAGGVRHYSDSRI